MYGASFDFWWFQNVAWLQPLFPGESGVDQLVEIIKVQVIYFFVFL